MSTVAIHVIWTTYMTWPPGDPRGHWSPLFDMYGGLIERGHKLNLPDPVTLQMATELARESPRVCGLPYAPYDWITPYIQ